MQDLPVRLILIIGMQSGGTSAASQILASNGYWIRHPRSFYEDGMLGHLFNELEYPDGFSPPSEPPTAEWIEKMEKFMYDYKAEAQTHKFNKAVIKYPNRPIWFPEVWKNLKICVEPVLVWRDPEKVSASLHRRWKEKIPDRDTKAQRGQHAIRRLNEEYGWPMWKFGVDATQEELGRLIGEDLPVGIFSPDKIHMK